MKVYCKWSGVSFLAEGFTNKMEIEGIHPIFYAPQQKLLNRAGHWSSGQMNENERRLLFLALLKSAKNNDGGDLVLFRATAKPSDAIIQQNMEQLLMFIAWHNTTQSPQLKLPQFVVNSTTADLQNVRQWLKSWFKCREDWEAGIKITGLRHRLSKKEEALERLIKSNLMRNETHYTNVLTDWALEASSVPENLKDHFRELFKLKDLALYQANPNELEELVEHMEENLTHGSIYASTVMAHVRRLRDRNKQGLAFGLGMPNEDLAKMDFAAIAANPFTIVEDDVETHNKKVAIDAAPSKKPVRSDYPSLLAYLRAEASYTLARAEETKLMLAEEKDRLETKQLEDMLKQEASDNFHAGQETTEDDFEDINLDVNVPKFGKERE
jgi:hypothetical protein